MILEITPFRYNSRPEILDLIPLRSYSHFHLEREREDLKYGHQAK